jgi:hypothetical protein
MSSTAFHPLVATSSKTPNSTKHSLPILAEPPESPSFSNSDSSRFRASRPSANRGRVTPPHLCCTFVDHGSSRVGHDEAGQQVTAQMLVPVPPRTASMSLIQPLTRFARSDTRESCVPLEMPPMVRLTSGVLTSVNVIDPISELMRRRTWVLTSDVRTFRASEVSRRPR